MSELDLRWQQRLSNYRRALSQRQKFLDHGQLTELEQQGLIKAFEFTHELTWNVLRQLFFAVQSPRTEYDRASQC